MADTILVVEEKQNLRGIYKTELQGEGYCVVTATDGHDAIDKLYDKEVDLVVLDLALPDGNGLDYLQDIVGFNRNIKVVINTDDPTYKMDFHSWLADAFLEKSPDLFELKNTIDVLLHS